jgi:hypothetical protein
MGPAVMCITLHVYPTPQAQIHSTFRLRSDFWIAWVPQVGEWLRSKGALSKYESAFVDEKVNGRRLTTLNEESLKNKLGVMSLGHRKEMMRQIQALLEGRKNFLKQ